VEIRKKEKRKKKKEKERGVGYLFEASFSQQTREG